MSSQAPADKKFPPVQIKSRPHATLFRLGLQPLIVHFKSLGNGYMDPAILETFDTKILKRILTDTAKSAEVREQLGLHKAVWLDLKDLFYASTICLTEQCCQRTGEDDGKEDEIKIASSALIVHHYNALVKDIARLISLVAVARNILTVGEEVQNLAADYKIEESIFLVIGLCVKVTARGFDSGGTGSKEEERKWQSVVNDFKRLLCTCLQFLNNLVAQNERRKLLLWVQLFDSPQDGDANGQALERKLIDGLRENPVILGKTSQKPSDPRDGVPHVIRRFKDGLMAHVHRFDEEKAATNPPVLDKEHLSSSPFLLYIGKVGMDIKKELHDAGKPAGATEIAAECKRRWQAMSKDEQKGWHYYYARLLASYREELDSQEDLPKTDELDKDKGKDPVRHDIVALAQSVGQIQSDLRGLLPPIPNKAYDALITGDFDPNTAPNFANDVQNHFPYADTLEATPADESDYRVTYTSEYGVTILQQGKEDLLRRLEPDTERHARSRRARTRSPPPPRPVEVPQRSESQPIPDPPDAPLTLASEDEREPLSEDDDDESEYDDPVPGDDGRGLLTDVPLILGPTEIEVLPMIIQSGIVPPSGNQPGHGESKEEIDALQSMHTLRCHLLLAQDNGRNLIRELLIFVAAWDLREEELYFQLMTQIIEAILLNGLLPFSYHAFRESKDIISPAQAVIMKLLTHIFRRRQSETARRGLAIFPRTQKDIPPKVQTYPQRVDAHMVCFLFTEFRRHIIPQTCALIFLQGQIRNGTVSPDEFPLNLWDMERMYEGVYQYLEFFAILTEHDAWKKMMALWEITSELVTLLEELDVAIPRSTPRHQPNHKQRATSKALVPMDLPQVQHRTEAQQPATVAVERPYDPHAPVVSPEPPASMPTAPPPLEDEPSDFEWRNLKKLAVLVLSSLVWKSPTVQAQLGAPGLDGIKGRGVRGLLNCCKVDDYNPYIREHAIMALRFALEGNQENQDIVRNLEKMAGQADGVGAGGTAEVRANTAGRTTTRTATGVKVEVPREVLDLNGYETFVDSRGQVQLKKRDAGDGNSALHDGGVEDPNDFM